MDSSEEPGYRGESELTDFDVEEEVANIYAQVDGIYAQLDNLVTREDLEKAKSDLTWRFVTWSLGLLACIAGIVGVVIAALNYAAN